MTVTGLAHSWADIAADFETNWLVYFSMPLVAALVGYTTKLVALQMVYWPIEFVGIGPIGWQGVVPRRAGKTAALTMQMLTEKLLKPEELLDEIDVKKVIEDLRGPLTRAADAVARQLAEQLRPGLWNSLPAVAREAVLSRVHAAAPGIVESLLAQIQSDFSRFVDLQYLAVTTLVKNKRQLNALMKGLGSAAMTFMRRSGVYFGLAIGLIQMVAWAYFRNPWIMPAFGFFTGFVSDWLALNLIFIPRKPRKLLGLVPMHGVLHAQRDQITRDYARMLANDLFSPDVVLDALLHGPTSERLLSAVEKEVSAEIDARAGFARPLLALAIGTKHYRAMSDAVTGMVIEQIPDVVQDAKKYAAKKLDLENIIIDKMRQLTPDQYESILRPIFKDDELLVVTVGAVLGFLVGELQVVLVEQFSR